jgi:hypothetical protein
MSPRILSCFWVNVPNPPQASAVDTEKLMPSSISPDWISLRLPMPPAFGSTSMFERAGSLGLIMSAMPAP